MYIQADLKCTQKYYR